MNQESTKYKSILQENKVATELKAKTVIASGSLWNHKGDVRSAEFLVECKTTKNSYYSLKHSVWEKIHREAVKDGLRIPVMCVDLENGKYRMAVFESRSLDHYKLYPQVVKNVYPRWTDKKSIRIVYSPVKMVEVYINTPVLKKPIDLVFIPWESFLMLIRGGK